MKTVIEDEGEGSTSVDCTNMPTVIAQSFGTGAEDDIAALVAQIKTVVDSNVLLNERLTELEGIVAEFDPLAGQLPVNTIVEVDDSVSDMALFMGYGVWNLFGRGRVTVCSGAISDAIGQTRTFAVAETGGVLKHPLSTNENGEHQHTFGLTNIQIGSKNINNFNLMSVDEGSDIKTTKSGLGEPHENIQPFVVVQRWKRVG